MKVSGSLGRQQYHAVGYKRVSTADQATEGHSLDAQHDAIIRFASQRGWKLVRIYEDSGISGTRSDRPALEQLLDDAAQGQFDVVIVHAIDRFYRDLQGLLKALSFLQKHDVAFISLAENIDFTTPWGKLALAVLGTLAEIYIDKLSAETSKAWRRSRLRSGRALTSTSSPGAKESGPQPERTRIGIASVSISHSTASPF